MTYAEIDEYNRTRGPGEQFLFTLRIDRATDTPIVTDEGAREW
jgi:hypothetical protein